MTTWALVPLKSPDAAKSRLSSVLTPAERRALYFVLARRVITALTAASGIQRVAVVTASDEVEVFAHDLGAHVIRARDAGTADAFAAGVRHLGPLELPELLMMAGDLPWITPAAVESVLLAGERPGVVIVPDRWRIGTNAMLCSPPDIVTPCFGVDSFHRHLAAAEKAGASARILECDALALDLDTPADLDRIGLPPAAFERPARRAGTVVGCSV